MDIGFFSLKITWDTSWNMDKFIVFNLMAAVGGMRRIRIARTLLNLFRRDWADDITDSARVD